MQLKKFYEHLLVLFITFTVLFVVYLLKIGFTLAFLRLYFGGK
jgi:hypothetical protein